MRATSILKHDQIFLSFVGESDGKIVNRSFSFLGTGQQLDKKGAPNGGRELVIPKAAAKGGEPVFPMAEYTDALKRDDNAEAQRITTQYRQAYAEYRADNGGDVAQGLVNSVVNFLRDELGVNTKNDGWRVEADKIVVTVPERNGNNSVLWKVQPAPVWGF